MIRRRAATTATSTGHVRESHCYNIVVERPATIAAIVTISAGVTAQQAMVTRTATTKTTATTMAATTATNSRSNNNATSNTITNDNKQQRGQTNNDSKAKD